MANLQSLIPFITIGGLVALIGNQGGAPVPMNVPTGQASQDSIVQPYQPFGGVMPKAVANPRPQATPQQPRIYSNGYTDSGHQNTLIGDMVHQLRHQGQLDPGVVNYADDVLARCEAIAPPKPPVCN